MSKNGRSSEVIAWVYKDLQTLYCPWNSTSPCTFLKIWSVFDYMLQNFNRPVHCQQLLGHHLQVPEHRKGRPLGCTSISWGPSMPGGPAADCGHRAAQGRTWRRPGEKPTDMMISTAKIWI
jgi:hypothetical protein